MTDTSLRLVPVSDNYQMLDALRFVAAYGVVCLHYRDYLAPKGGLVYRLLGTGSLFVDLFFLISGFIIASVYYNKMHNWHNFWSYMRKRIARLVPLHWLTLLMYLTIAIGTLLLGIGVTDRASYDMNCFIPNLFLIHSTGICDHLTFNGVSWSISAEMIMYFMFPAFLVIFRAGAIWTLAIGILFFIALSAVSNMLLDYPWYQWTYANGWLRAIPSFIIGMSVFGLRHRLPMISHAYLLAWAALAASYGLQGAGAPELVSLVVMYVVFVFAVIADRSGEPGRTAIILAPFGNLTYSIYMLHPIVLTFVVTVLGRQLVLTDGPTRYSAGYFGLAAILPVAWLSLVFFEMPCRRRFGGSSQRLAKPVA